MSGTYDADALVAAESGHRQMWALHRRALERLHVPTVPTGVLGWAWRGGPQPLQARLELCVVDLKTEYPHPLAIRDPATLRAELAITRAHYNGVRLHAGVGYVTPNDEHEGRGKAIRKARQAGLEQARLHRLAWHRNNRHTRPARDPDDVG